MSVERLSKLQKWLLLTLFDSKTHIKDEYQDSDDYSLYRRQIFRRWLKGYNKSKWLTWTEKKAIYNKGQVTLTRSIDSLYYKGYVELMSTALVVARHNPYGKDDPGLATMSVEAAKMRKLLGQAAGMPGTVKVWLVNLTDKGLERAKELK